MGRNTPQQLGCTPNYGLESVDVHQSFGDCIAGVAGGFEAGEERALETGPLIQPGPPQLALARAGGSLRYDSASAMCARRTPSMPSRSASVRATFKTR